LSLAERLHPSSSQGDDGATPMPKRREADVCIVGAGLAGLVAARDLVAAGRSVVVLEARDRVGGRLLNHDIGDGKVIEVGGQWVGPTQDRAYALAGQLGIQTFPSYETGEALARVEGKRYRFTGDVPRMNPLAMADLAQAVLRLDRLARRVPLEEPWRAPGAHRWDSETFETWLRRNVRTRRVRSLLHLFITTVFATEPATFSLLHGLFYVHSGTSFDVLTRFSGGAQQDRLVGGSQLLAIRLADALGEAVVLRSPVRRIHRTAGIVTAESDRVNVRARRTIVAIPPALAGRITYDPILPGARDQLTQRLPQGSVIKAQAIYDEPFWRSEGLSGIAADPRSPVSFTVDNSPVDGSPGILMGFIDGDNARRLGRLEPDDRRRIVLESLSRSFGSRAASPRDYVEMDWSEEEWTRGCFGAHFPPGVWTQYGPALRQPVGLIHWAGTETASVWNGYMDGAVRSGERAAGEVLELVAEPAATSDQG
jgi:monoamine oxidase